jgi:hypothetical protein
MFLFFAGLVIAVNFYVDHHAIRLSLFSGNKAAHQKIYPDGINQHIFNPEFIFHNSDQFDSFLFGSSRTTMIDVSIIPSGRFYNMSYSLGLPAQHLAILKAFIQRGIKIHSVVIGLDEFCFSLPAAALEKHLIRIMHPDIGGPGRLEIFYMYFFRKPDINEISRWKDRVLLGKTEGRFIMDNRGVNLGWRDKDVLIETAGKPLFDFTVQTYEPMTYGSDEMNEAFAAIKELIALSQTHHFSLTFFITPFYSQLYLNHAEPLFIAKERLATLSDYYDFSGFNSITTDAMNYFEESHYRYRVGDMIINRIYGVGSLKAPDDFGVFVTRQNVAKHVENQKSELKQYLVVPEKVNFF